MMAPGRLPVLLLALLAWGCGTTSGSGVNETGEGAETAQTVEEELPWPVLVSGLRDAAALDVVPTDGRILILERGRHRLLVIGDDGTRLDSLGVRGRGNYRFDTPESLDATNGLQLFVSDLNNGRVQQFDRRLSYLSSIKPSGAADSDGFFRPGPLVVNTFGELFVTDADSGELLRFDRNGRLLQRTDLRDSELMLPVRGMLVREDVLFILESGRGLVHELGSQGSWRRFIAGTEGSMAVAAERDLFWVISAGELAAFSWEGREMQRFRHGISEPATGLAAGVEALYVLTATAVYRIPRSAITEG